MPASSYSSVGFSDIQQLLDDAVGGGESDIGAHGTFWRGLTRDQFLQFSVFGQPLIAVDASGQFDPDNSALVLALEGRAPFGRDMGVPGARFRRMPAGMPPMPPANIQALRDWIKAGCKP